MRAESTLTVPTADPSPAVPPPDAAALRPPDLLRLLWLRHRQERTSRLDRAALQRHQQRQFERLRAVAMERSPYYRRVLAGLQGAPLHELPVLDKATLMAHFDELVTDRAIRLADVERHLASGSSGLYLGRYTALSTSGSTGRRGVFVFDRAEWLAALAAITRPVAWAGRFSTLETLRRPRSALIASAAPWHYSARVGRSLASARSHSLRLDAGSPLPDLVRQLNEWQPQLLAVYPSVLLRLADEQLAGRLHIAPRHIGTSAEPLPAATRERVRAAFGVPVFDTYGATEYAPIAAECAAGHLHLFEDRALIEVVDASGRPVPPGQPGERLLLTVLDRLTQPLIRYEISDRVREVDDAVAGPCPCGRALRRLQRVEGRVEESLSFEPLQGAAAPVVLQPLQLHTLLERLPVAGWQLVQHGDRGPLDLRLAGSAQPAVAEAAASSLQGLLRSQGARDPGLTVRWVDELERGPSGKALLIRVVRDAVGG